MSAHILYFKKKEEKKVIQPTEKRILDKRLVKTFKTRNAQNAFLAELTLQVRKDGVSEHGRHL